MRGAGRSRALACAEVISARMLAVGAMPTHLGLMLAADVDAEVKALPHGQMVVRVLAIGFESRMNAWARCEAELIGTRAMIAADLFRAERGDWPRDLEELVPKYLAEVPEDPYTGRALRYRRLEQADEFGRGYVLYSAGVDREDDGGTLHESGAAIAGRPEGTGSDLVFTAKQRN